MDLVKLSVLFKNQFLFQLFFLRATYNRARRIKATEALLFVSFNYRYFVIYPVQVCQYVRDSQRTEVLPWADRDLQNMHSRAGRFCQGDE